MQVHVATDRLARGFSRQTHADQVAELMRQVIDEGRHAVRGLRSSSTLSLDLEDAFARIQEELNPAGGNAKQIEFRVIIEGRQQALNPLLRDEIYALAGKDYQRVPALGRVISTWS